VKLRRGQYAVTERPECDVELCTKDAMYRVAMGHSERVVVKQYFICQWHLDMVIPPRTHLAHRKGQSYWLLTTGRWATP
jgi:hypothetical protein